MSFKKVIFILLLTAFHISSNSQNIADYRVLEGQLVLDGAYPFMGLIYIHENDFYNKHFECGATLIHPRWLLTAAHCINETLIWSFNDWKAAINISDIRDPWDFVEKIKIDSVIPYSLYDPFPASDQPRYDIALLHLAQAAKATPIRLAEPADSFLYLADTPCRVLGWGATRYLQNTTTRPDNLRQGDLWVIGYPGCYDTVAVEVPFDTEIEFCAGTNDGPPAGSATGDSGGPLISWNRGEWIQIGVVNRAGGGLYSKPGAPGIYAKIAYYYPWIQEVINSFGDQLPSSRQIDTTFQVVDTSQDLLLHFERPSLVDYEIVVFNTIGQELYRTSISKSTIGSMSISKSIFPSGLFVLSIYQSDQIWSTKFYVH